MAHVVTVIYIKIWTYDTWLIKYTRYLMKKTSFDDFDKWQNVDVQVLIERI